MPLHPDWATRNVAAEERDPGSMLNLHRALLKLRRERDALSVGSWHAVAGPAGVLAYERRHGSERLLVLLNLTGVAVTMAWQGVPLLSTLDGEPEPGMLRPDEGMIVE